MINDAIRALSDAELVVLMRDAAAKSGAAVEIRPRLARFWHALAAELDAEACRRGRLLDELDPDEAGELVTDVDAAIAEARRQLREQAW